MQERDTLHIFRVRCFIRQGQFTNPRTFLQPKAAVDEDFDKLKDLPACDFAKSKATLEVTRDVLVKKRRSPGLWKDPCDLKHAELASHIQMDEERVVLRDSVDESGVQEAFTEGAKNQQFQRQKQTPDLPADCCQVWIFEDTPNPAVHTESGLFGLSLAGLLWDRNVKTSSICRNMGDNERMGVSVFPTIPILRFDIRGLQDGWLHRRCATDVENITNAIHVCRILRRHKTTHVEFCKLRAAQVDEKRISDREGF